MACLLNAPSRVLGFDVAKDTITLHDTGPLHDRGNDRTVTIANRGAAIREILAPLAPDAFCVLEPTGGHERRLLAELAAAGLACHRADTLKVKAFQRSYGQHAKTDAIDAKALANYGVERWRQLPLFMPVDATRAELASLVSRRRDLIGLKVAEENRAKAPALQRIKASCAAVLRTLRREIAAIEKEIDALIDTSPDLSRRRAICQSLPGVGPRTSVSLLATMPELGSLTRRQVASLAGLAPHPNDSGTLKGYRRMRGGRPEVRTSLFMAALAASRAKGPLRAQYQRLLGNGKKPIVAISALMRKIVVILNARIRDDLAKQS